jgi:hypothetical protein
MYTGTLLLYVVWIDLPVLPCGTRAIGCRFVF